KFHTFFLAKFDGSAILEKNSTASRTIKERWFGREFFIAAQIEGVFRPARRRGSKAMAGGIYRGMEYALQSAQVGASRRLSYYASVYRRRGTRAADPTGSRRRAGIPAGAVQAVPGPPRLLWHAECPESALVRRAGRAGGAVSAAQGAGAPFVAARLRT